MSNVFYASARSTDFDYLVSLPAKLEELLEHFKKSPAKIPMPMQGPQPGWEWGKWSIIRVFFF